jgi:hypothetical protein
MDREDDILQDINSGFGPPWESVGPLYIQTGPPGKVPDLHGCKLDPRMGSGPLCVRSGPLTVGSQVSGIENTQALIKARRGSGADTCPDLTVYASAPRSGGAPMLPRGMVHVT